MVKRTVIAAVVLVVAVGSTYVGLRWRALSNASDQWRNMERGRTCVREIDDFKRRYGAYPATLQQAVRGEHRLDAWGRPFSYATKGGGFLLVSYGRDGAPDPEVWDPWRARNPALTTHEAPKYVWTICGRPDADQIMSDFGEHRICGK